MRLIPCTLAAAWLLIFGAQAADATNLVGNNSILPTNADLPDDAEIKFRFSMMQSPVEANYDADAKAYLQCYLTYGIRGTEAMLGRGMIYMPVIEHYLELHGLPSQLKYLPIVESGLMPHAVSTKGAAGLWQIVPETARALGLVVDGKLDERKDPNRSTEAAVKYLKRLKKRYGNWELAMVAYNCGPGRLNTAIQKAGSRDYARVKRFLPKETQLYLARYLAAAYIANYFRNHEITPALPDHSLYTAMAARVYREISLQRIAKLTGVGLATLRHLNPSYKSDSLPARKAGTFLTLPKYAWDAYLRALHTTVLRP